MKASKAIISLSAAACLCSAAARAENWTIEPRVEVGAETDDNYRLLPINANDSVSGGFGDVRFDIHTVDPVNELRFAPGVRATWYPNSKDDQSTDPYAELEASHRGEKSLMALNAGYIKQSVVNSDRVTSDIGGGLGNPGGGDSGYIALRNRRQLITVNPSLTYNLTQLDKLDVLLTYADANYEKYIPNTNVGYVAVGAQLGLTHALTERHSVTGRVVYSRNDPDTPPGVTLRNSKTDSYGLQGEWTMRVSDLSQAYARLGVQRSKFDRVATGGSDTQNTYVAGAGVNWSFQVTQIFLDLTRTVDPSSSGFSVERNQVRMRVTRQFTPLTSGFFALRGIKDQALDSGAVFRDRSYGVATLGAEMRFRREWSLRAEYDYTRQKYKGDPGPGKSNAFMLSVVYEPKRETDSVGRYRR
jgi:hypothetical protein